MCYHLSAQTTITAVAQILAPHWSSLLHLTASGKHHESLALIVLYGHILISHCSSKAFRCRQGLGSETRARNGIRGCDSRPGTEFTNMLLLSHSHLFFSMFFPLLWCYRCLLCILCHGVNTWKRLLPCLRKGWTHRLCVRHVTWFERTGSA